MCVCVCVCVCACVCVCVCVPNAFVGVSQACPKHTVQATEFVISEGALKAKPISDGNNDAGMVCWEFNVFLPTRCAGEGRGGRLGAGGQALDVAWRIGMGWSVMHPFARTTARPPAKAVPKPR